jgi:hypothetical protein
VLSGIRKLKKKNSHNYYKPQAFCYEKKSMVYFKLNHVFYKLFKLFLTVKLIRLCLNNFHGLILNNK